ncbi:hypothetical protein EYY99_17775 [Hafnia alvei]|uniref:hypothetical protein n=1 Tax=Hafnia alvei TaxID=569 RepID=UPI00069663F9|nr:hypothetical protein [Hafnia alvei]MBW3475109.1 hypothetical protein [Hafnia alvei]MDU3158006.1 hypothetical protein [Hafnia alvei]QBJ32013.1 hypothetical protein EYZ02_03310 [Hafnia alvei]TBL42942.1 hypothetical protein EYY99_17775 [Hafnia alvei]TBM15915.1 hypothetical protein EYY83_09090 [Hafnia alvei]
MAIKIMLLIGGFICGVVALLYLFSDSDQLNNSHLVKSYQVCDGVYVSILLDDTGGATVPFFYQYYLMEHRIISLKNKKQFPAPVLISDVSSAKIICDGNRIKINVIGRVFEFTNRVLVKNAQGSARHIDLVAISQ